jgi:hypothetical protein
MLRNEQETDYNWTTHTLVKLSVSSTCHATYMVYCYGDHSFARQHAPFRLGYIQPQGCSTCSHHRFPHAAAPQTGAGSKFSRINPESQANPLFLHPSPEHANGVYLQYCRLTPTILPGVRPACRLGLGTSVRYM